MYAEIYAPPQTVTLQGFSLDTRVYVGENSAVRVTLGDAMRKARRRKRMNLLAVSAATAATGETPIDKGTINRIETGKTKRPDPETLRRIAIALGEAPDYFEQFQVGAADADELDSGALAPEAMDMKEWLYRQFAQLPADEKERFMDDLRDRVRAISAKKTGAS